MARTKETARDPSSKTGHAVATKSRPTTARKTYPGQTPRRLKAGTKALREIRRYQKSTGFLMQRMPFRRLAKRIASEHSNEPTRFQQAAVDAMQEAFEVFLVGLLENAGRLAIHAGRVTVMEKDLTTASQVCSMMGCETIPADFAVLA